MHIPVLLNEVIALTNPKALDIVVDCTFGAGGYSKALLCKTNCSVIAIDQDISTFQYAKEIMENHDFSGRFSYTNMNFCDLEAILKERNVEKADIIIADLGVSSMQLDTKSRGFSFQQDAELDMRMSQSGISAKDVVNSSSQEELANIIYQFGEEHFSRRIAKVIVEKRTVKQIVTTNELAEIILSVYPKKHYHKIHPATKTFQALRIFVNDELQALKKLLTSSEKVLKVGGRLAIVSFHSLEDRMVKDFLQKRSKNQESTNRFQPERKSNFSKSFKIINKKVVVPCEAELKANPRARSARLRVAERIENE